MRFNLACVKKDQYECVVIFRQDDKTHPIRITSKDGQAINASYVLTCAGK